MSLLKIAELESQLKRRDAHIAELEAAQAGQSQPVAWYSEKHQDFINHETKQDHARLNSYTHKHGGFDKPLFDHAAPAGETNKLLRIIACAYQIIGTHDAPGHILDVLGDPKNATDEQIGAILPYMPLEAGQPAPARQPLSDEEIFKLTGMGYRSPIDKQLTLSVARAIEAKITGAAHD